MAERRARAVAPRANAGRSLTEIAVSVIRDRIIDLTLAPGSRVDERLLMDRFGLSRTPAREALNRLTAEGFVTIESNKGASVRSLDVAHVKHFFDAYFAAERMSAYFCDTHHPGLVDALRAIQADHDRYAQGGNYLSLTEANARFHIRIAMASDNAYVIEFCTRLQQQGRRISHLIYMMEFEKSGGTDRHRGRVRDQHKRIVTAIARHDNARLVGIMTEHAQLFHDRIMGVVGAVRGGGLDFARPTVATGTRRGWAT